jgi:hypothetical protein
MSFSYDPSLTEDKDQVRFLVQDTNASKQLFQDEEIAWVLRTEANIYTAAAQLCDLLIAKAGSTRKKIIGDLSITYDVVFYRSLAGNLRARGAGHQMPYAGGISITGKQQQQGDSDATPPSVFRNLEENPAAPSVSVPPINPLETI